MLAFLSSVAKGVPQKLEVMSQLVSSLFDLNPNISSYMKVREKGGGAVLGIRGQGVQTCMLLARRERHSLQASCGGLLCLARCYILAV
jgi:hypothetical protein